nr:VIT domain-containing protein [uncultured Carboxylicivirga sp.]
MCIRKVLITSVVLLACCLTSMCSQIRNLPPANPNVFPRLSIKNDSVELEIHRMSVDVKTMSNIALTTYDITFYNPLNRLLEGEFSFPLKSNQQIVGFAMDVNGILREGVVVEKNKGRRVFETIVRRGIDPGLLEKTSGNNFRLRVYPIPAKGTKRIKITCQEELVEADQSYIYQLPLMYKNPIEDFSIVVNAVKSDVKPIITDNDFTMLSFKSDGDNYVASSLNVRVQPSGLFQMKLPIKDHSTSLFTSRFGNYFYATFPIDFEPKHKEQLDSIAVLWDVSGSGSNRDMEKELQLLSSYLNYHQTTHLSIYAFNHQLKRVREVTVKGEIPTQLKAELMSMVYDGGSRLDQIDLNSLKGKELIIFSDGMMNLGELPETDTQKMIIAINSSQVSDHTFLRNIRPQERVVFIDLGTSTIESAYNKMITDPLYVKTSVASGEVNYLVGKLSSDQNRVIVSGRGLSDEAVLDVKIVCGDKVLINNNFQLQGEASYELPIARLCAANYITVLSQNKEDNKDEIIRMAKAYGVVTDYTSLMVLERVEDYVRFKIDPPAELQKEYNELLQRQAELNSPQIEVAKSDTLPMVEAFKKWWNTSYPLPNAKLPDIAMPGSIEEELVPAIREQPAITRQQEQAPPPPPAIANQLTIVEEDVTFDEELSLDFTDMSVEEEAADAPVFFMIADREAEDLPPRRGGSDVPIIQTPAIKVNTVAWDSTAVYIADIQQLPTNELYSYYLNKKGEYSKQPSFYLDMASYLFEKGRIEEGVSVITNIAELKIDNAEIYRIVGQKLLQVNQVELAVKVYEKILELRPEDVQSYRDLALAYQKQGSLDKAVDMLKKAIEKQDIRGNRSITGILVNELNALLNCNKTLANTDSIPVSWLYKMPVDIRIVLSWSSDNSDVDLWVTEPTGERCYYQNKNTYLGGRLSQDITNGFGPEEYCIKKAVKGHYFIQANYYGDRRQSISGPITLYAEIFRNYGTSRQTIRRVVLQLKDKKQVIDLAEILVE